MKVNINKLWIELQGFPIVGIDEDGVLSWGVKPTQEQLDQTNEIIKNHTPEWYVDGRKEAYPSIGDQLDMMYWDKINNTNIWETKIIEIKKKYPKE